MATWTVGSTGDFPSIQDANDSLGVQPGDFINLLANYSGETATITKEHLTINGDATNSNIALNFDQTTLTLTGLAPIDVTAAASPNDVTLTGNGGANALMTTSRAAPETTRSPAATATTRSTAVRATTRWSERLVTMR